MRYWGIDEIGAFVLPAALAIWALRPAERKEPKLAEDVENEDPDAAA